MQQTNDFLKKYKEPETILFRHVSQRYSLNMKEMYGDPLFFEELKQIFLDVCLGAKLKSNHPNSAELRQTPPNSAEELGV